MGSRRVKDDAADHLGLEDERWTIIYNSQHLAVQGRHTGTMRGEEEEVGIVTV